MVKLIVKARYVGPTDTKGSRFIVGTHDGKLKRTFPYDYASDDPAMSAVVSWVGAVRDRIGDTESAVRPFAASSGDVTTFIVTCDHGPVMAELGRVSA